MKYKITSIYPQAYQEAINELICCGISFAYDAQQQAIFADLTEDVKNSFCENIQATFERVELTDQEIRQLYNEVYDILEEKYSDKYPELSTPITATMSYEDGRREEIVLTVCVEAIGIEDCDIIFYTTNDETYRADYFDKADRAKVFNQFLKDLNEA